MSKETSAIRYSLKANRLPSASAPFMAQVHGYKTVHLTANTILFNLPQELAAGNYTLLVRSGYGSAVREGKLEHTVSVN